MGAWGYGPTESDQAMDWLHDLGAVTKTREFLTNVDWKVTPLETSGEAVRAAAALMVATFRILPWTYEDYRLVLVLLRELRASGEYIGSWAEAWQIKDEIQIQTVEVDRCAMALHRENPSEHDLNEAWGV